MGRIKAVIRRSHTRPAVAGPKPEGVADTPAPAPSRVVSQRGYDDRLSILQDVRVLLETRRDKYRPTEPVLSLEGIAARVEAMRACNTASRER